MDYAMLAAGSALLLTVSFGKTTPDILTKILFRLIPLSAAAILLIVSLNNLQVI